jgi:hypothetical protein
MPGQRATRYNPQPHKKTLEEATDCLRTTWNCSRALAQSAIIQALYDGTIASVKGILEAVWCEQHQDFLINCREDGKHK